MENYFQVSDPDANNGRMPLCSAFINLLGGQGVHWLLWSHVSKIFLLLQVSFPGLVVCIWLIYGFSFCHFSTVPAQVLFSFYWYFLHSPFLGHWFVPAPIEQCGCRDHRWKYKLLGKISIHHQLTRSCWHLFIWSSWNPELGGDVEGLGPSDVPLLVHRPRLLQLPRPHRHGLCVWSGAGEGQAGDENATNLHQQCGWHCQHQLCWIQVTSQ